MPHLQFATFAGQVFWLAVSFMLLYVVLWRIVLPKISRVIEDRGSMIAANLAQAEDMENEVKRVRQSHDNLLAETAEKARQLIDESMHKAHAAVEQKRLKLSAKLEEKLARAEKEITKVEKDSKAVVDKVSAELTALIISKFKAA